MRSRKYFTVKEWNCFKNNDYFDMQDMLCQKYDVILTDYKTKREKVFSALKKINLKNFDKGVTEFSKLVQLFGSSMEQLTREIDSPKQKGSRYKKATSGGKDNENLDIIWGTSDDSVPIWGTSEDNCDSQARHKSNLEKIWGRGN